MREHNKGGGPAFPVPPDSFDPHEAGTWSEALQGMTLRDYFAAHALAGLLANERAVGTLYSVKKAYEAADAMLKARDK